MNNKGFTLIELLGAIMVITIVMVVSFGVIGNTFSVTNDKAYEIFERNIINQTKNYILECDNNLINCNKDYKWEKVGNVNRTTFTLNVMKKYDYFKNEDFIDPVTMKDVSDCLIIEVTKDELYNINVYLDNKKC